MVPAVLVNIFSFWHLAAATAGSTTPGLLPSFMPLQRLV
jgi:hypothetical protein